MTALFLGALKIVLCILAVLLGLAMLSVILWIIVVAFCLTLETIYNILGKEEPDWLENTLDAFQ